MDEQLADEFWCSGCWEKFRLPAELVEHWEEKPECGPSEDDKQFFISRHRIENGHR